MLTLKKEKYNCYLKRLGKLIQAFALRTIGRDENIIYFAKVTCKFAALFSGVEVNKMPEMQKCEGPPTISFFNSVQTRIHTQERLGGLCSPLGHRTSAVAYLKYLSCVLVAAWLPSPQETEKEQGLACA